MICPLKVEEIIPVGSPLASSSSIQQDIVVGSCDNDSKRKLSCIKTKSSFKCIPGSSTNTRKPLTIEEILERMKIKSKPKVMNCGAHDLICGPPLDRKVREKTENLQSDKGQSNSHHPVEANRGNCGVMGVNFQESQLKERVSKSNIRMPDGQLSTSSTESYVYLTENSDTVNPDEE